MSLNNVFGEGGGNGSVSFSEEVMPSFTTMQLPTPLLKYGQQGNPRNLCNNKTSLHISCTPVAFAYSIPS